MPKVEAMQHDRGEEEEEHRSPVRGTTDGDSFDLAALRLSPLGSPAMPTASSDVERFSITSNGHSLATNEGEEDDDTDGDAASSDDGNDEEEGEQGKHEAHHGNDSLSSSEQEKEEETAVQNNKDVTKSDELREDQEEESTAAVEVALPVTTQAPSNPPALLLTSLPMIPSRDGDSDDDLTVECASPRDPLELEETPAPTTDPQVIPATERVSHLTSAVVHPSPSTHSSATVLPSPSPVVYSLNAIFPVVYENSQKIRQQTNSSSPHYSQPTPKKLHGQPRPAERTRSRQAKIQSLGMAAKLNGNKELALTPQATDEIRIEKNQIATKALRLQLQVTDTDRKQLTQRNARLKSLIAVLTTDLIRTKADAAKYKTENEVYAAKVPELQAELNDETTHLDEKHAQTIQSQLEITQLRAKLQVLQTRAGNLDDHNEKLQNELRLVKKDMRRRAIVQQQTDEKLKRLEADLHATKASHAQSQLLHKRKLTAMVQQLDHERVRREAELKKTYHHQLEELRAALIKAKGKWKDLEHSNAAREHELVAMKKRLDDGDEEARTRDRQAKTTETQLARAERTEASLRSQVAALKVHVKAAEREASRVLRTSTVPRQVRSRLTSRQRETTLPSPRRQSSSSISYGETATSLCSCCQMVLDSMAKADRFDNAKDSDDAVTSLEMEPHYRTSSVTCFRCVNLETEVTTLQAELGQLRALHTNELKVQATAYERVLSAFRGAVHVDATLQCA